MTTQTLQHHHLLGRKLGLGVAVVVLAAAAGYGVVTWVTVDPVPVAPAQDVSGTVNTDGARDSWEGRIGPEADDQTGARDSWMPPGMTDQQAQKLEQLR